MMNKESHAHSDTYAEDLLREEINKYLDKATIPTIRGLCTHLKMSPDRLTRLEEEGMFTKIIYQARLRIQDIKRNARQA